MVSENIKYLRRELGLTQEEFGAKIGETRNVIANIESNRWSDTEKRKAIYRKIYRVFGVTEDWLMSDNPGEISFPDGIAINRDAERLGALFKNEDPVVKAFLDFWSQRTYQEKEILQKAINDFADALKEAQK